MNPWDWTACRYVYRGESFRPMSARQLEATIWPVAFERLFMVDPACH